MRPLQPKTPAEMRHGRHDRFRSAPDPAPAMRAGIRLAPSPDTGEAARLWEAHVDAGRIGVPAPTPPPEGEYRLASLEHILATARGRRAA